MQVTWQVALAPVAQVVDALVVKAVWALRRWS